MLMRRAVFVVALAAVCAALFWPSVDVEVPGPRLPWDKAVHAGMFALLAFLGGWARIRLRWLLLLLAALAVASEAGQALLLPHRTGDWDDLAADLVGVALGVGVWRWVGGPGAWRPRPS